MESNEAPFFYILSDLTMKKIIFGFLSCFLIFTTLTHANVCEKQWQEEQKNTVQIKKLKRQQCAYIWDDAKVIALLKKMNLKPKNGQWMVTDECDAIQVGQQKYVIYQAYYKNDLSDLYVIRDSNNNLYGFFRDLGKYSFVDDKFIPTATANQHGVDLKCAALGNNPKLSNILIQNLFQRKIDLTHYSYEDRNK